jgi:hypothetical protein
VLLGALAAACVVPGLAAAASAQCAKSYSYAGLTASKRSHGISATLSALASPGVLNGHVAGWVGVGGVGLGPGGSSEWIQVGLSAFPGTPSRIYYEVRQPDWAAKYVEVNTSVAPGERHRVAVLEARGKPNVWRVWVDGRAVSPMYYLPGSHAGWKPQATAESWNGDAGVCNNFAYGFERISLLGKPGGAWRALSDRGFEFEDLGYSMTRRSPASFVASSRALLRTLKRR